LIHIRNRSSGVALFAFEGRMSDEREIQGLAAIEAAQDDLRKSIERTRALSAETDRLIERNRQARPVPGGASRSEPG
jgi:hypothetical protein